MKSSIAPPSGNVAPLSENFWRHHWRQIRTTVPILSCNLLPAWPDLSIVREMDNRMKRRYSNAYNNRHGARSLSGLEAGQTVRVKNDSQKHWSPVVIVSGDGLQPRSYVVEMSDGKMVCRNRKHLQVIPDAVLVVNLVLQTNGSITQRGTSRENS